MEKIFVVKVLFESNDFNSCNVKLFKDYDSAYRYANDDIDKYGDEYNGNVTERASHLFKMKANNDTYVTIYIEEQVIIGY